MRTPLSGPVVVCLAMMAGVGLCAIPARAEPLAIIEDNFEAAIPGDRIQSGENPGNQNVLFPSIGRYYAFPGDEAEIVEAWDGQALQFQDVVDDALRLVYGATDVDFVDLVYSGELEVSLDFRIEGDVLFPSQGRMLQVSLQPTPLIVEVRGPDARIFFSDGHDRTNVNSMMREAEGVILVPDTIYSLKLLVSFDESTYSVQVADKETDNVVFEASNLNFPPVPELATNGGGKNLLNIVGGNSHIHETVNAVTIDNILVTHSL